MARQDNCLLLKWWTTLFLVMMLMGGCWDARSSRWRPVPHSDPAWYRGLIAPCPSPAAPICGLCDLWRRNAPGGQATVPYEGERDAPPRGNKAPVLAPWARGPEMRESNGWEFRVGGMSFAVRLGLRLGSTWLWLAHCLAFSLWKRPLNLWASISHPTSTPFGAWKCYFAARWGSPLWKRNCTRMLRRMIMKRLHISYSISGHLRVSKDKEVKHWLRLMISKDL